MKNWFRVRSQKNTVEIVIYDEVGGWGYKAKDLISELTNIGKSDINVRINSPGGDTFDGVAIYNYLKSIENKVTVTIDGLAASAASIIAMAGDVVKMGKGTMLMVHNPWMFAIGESNDLRDLADSLDQIKNQLIKIYQTKTGLDADVVENYMNKETWFEPEEAKNLGFVDEIVDGLKVAASAIKTFKDYNFQNIPEKFKQMAKTNKAKGGNVEEILKALGIKDESAVVETVKNLKSEMKMKDDKVKALGEKLNSLSEKNDKLMTEINLNRIELAVASKKITPAQKDFAAKLLAKDEDLFTSWLEGNEVPVPCDITEINSERETDLTFRNLLDDGKKYAEVFANQPELFNKLKENWIKGE